MQLHEAERVEEGEAVHVAVLVREGETEGECVRVWETVRVHDVAVPVTEELAVGGVPLAVGEGVGVRVEVVDAEGVMESE